MFTIEIRAAEGGDDAKDLVGVQADMYLRVLEGLSARFSVQSGTSSTRILVEGSKLYRFFESEAGGHRYQRVPPNEKRGRVHTSSVTVAVLPGSDEDAGEARIDEADCDVDYFRGGGPGGQHRNKTDSAVRIRHRPTGLVATRTSGRNQRENYATAFKDLQQQYSDMQRESAREAVVGERRNQIGTGRRGDKIRTVRIQADQVVDHQTGIKMSAKKYLKGQWGKLLKRRRDA